MYLGVRHLRFVDGVEVSVTGSIGELFKRGVLVSSIGGFLFNRGLRVGVTVGIRPIEEFNWGVVPGLVDMFGFCLAVTLVTMRQVIAQCTYQRRAGHRDGQQKVRYRQVHGRRL